MATALYQRYGCQNDEVLLTGCTIVSAAVWKAAGLAAMGRGNRSYEYVGTAGYVSSRERGALTSDGGPSGVFTCRRISDLASGPVTLFHVPSTL